MKLVVMRGHLKNAAAAVVGATGENQGLPILKNILIEAKDGKIFLVATNLEIATRACVPGKVIEGGAIAAPGATFLQIAASIGSERVGIEAKNNVLEIKTDTYQATLQGMAAEEFPIIPTIKKERGSITMKSATLKDAVAQVMIAAQPSDARPELASVLIHFATDNITFVATDSFRLAEKTLKSTQFQSTYGEAARMLIPLKTAHELVRVLGEDGDATIRDDGNQIIFETPTTTIVSRLIDGNFPDYGAVMPKEFGAQFALDGQEFASAVKQSAVFGARASEVKIKVADNKKSITISSVEQGLGENTSLVSARVDGEPRETSFNWRYLLDGVKAVRGKEIFMGLNREEGRAALLKAPGDASYVYVVMPIFKA